MPATKPFLPMLLYGELGYFLQRVDLLSHLRAVCTFPCSATPTKSFPPSSPQVGFHYAFQFQQQTLMDMDNLWRVGRAFTDIIAWSREAMHIQVNPLSRPAASLCSLFTTSHRHIIQSFFTFAFAIPFPIANDTRLRPLHYVPLLHSIREEPPAPRNSLVA